MTCAESRLFLHAHGDGELDIANSLELERHLKTCAACAAEKKSLNSLKAALRRSSLRYDAPDSLRREVRRMARASGNKTRQLLFQSLRLWKSLAFGAAAVAFLAIVLRPGIFVRDQMLNEAVASHVRSLMAEHLTDVTSSDQHTVKPWFSGKLDFSPPVTDFAGADYPLVGGRLDYLQGHSVAALVYMHRKHIINVFVWPMASAREELAPAVTQRGFHVIHGTHAGMAYWVVSDLNAEELATFSRMLVASLVKR